MIDDKVQIHNYASALAAALIGQKGNLSDNDMKRTAHAACALYGHVEYAFSCEGDDWSGEDKLIVADKEAAQKTHPILRDINVVRGQTNVK